MNSRRRRTVISGAALALLLVATPAAGFNDVIELPDEHHAEVATGRSDVTTRDLSGAISAYLATSGAQQSAFGDAIAALAQERRGYLRQTMRRNPAAALTLLLTDDERLVVETVSPGSSETPVSVLGELEVGVATYLPPDGSDPQVVNVHALRVGDQRLRLWPAHGAVDPGLTGQDVVINGHLLDDELVFDAAAGGITAAGSTTTTKGGKGSKSTATTEGAAEPNPEVHGDQRTVVVLMNFSNTTTTRTPAEIEHHVFTEMNAYYDEISYGKISFSGTVRGWYETHSPMTCSWTDMRDMAVALVDPEVDFTQVDRLIIVAPYYGCQYGGYGSIGKWNVQTADGTVRMSISWVREASAGLYLFGHEMGHNLGAHHASFLSCGEDPITSPSCSSLEYGDRYAIMGTGTAHWNAPHKDLVAGWFDAPNVVEVSEDGVYSVSPLELPALEPQALKVARGATDNWLYVEYRQPIGFDDTSVFNNTTGYQGALLHITPYARRTQLIDPTPPSNVTTSALLPGEIFTDPVTGTSVEVLGATPEQLDVSVTIGACTDFTPPEVTLTEPAVGSLVSDTITVAANAWDADSPIDRVEFYRRTSVWGVDELLGIDTEAPYSVQWDTTQVPNGSHSLFARAYDATPEGCQQNHAMTWNVWVTVANGVEENPPSVWLDAPLDGAKLAPPFSWSATATDDVGVARVELWVDPDGMDPCDVGNRHSMHPPFCKYWSYFPPYSKYFPGHHRVAYLLSSDSLEPYQGLIRRLPPGRYTVWARAYDFSYNQADSEPITLIVKGQRPFRIIILYGKGGAAAAAAGSVVTMPMDITADDDEIGYVEFRVDGELWYTETEPPYDFVWQVPAGAGLDYEIEATAFGLGGRTAADALTLTAE